MNSCLYVLDDISTLLHAMCVCSFFIYGRGRGLPVLELKGGRNEMHQNPLLVTRSIFHA
jgi:hypothetical protein